jgi:hypothetical protein
MVPSCASLRYGTLLSVTVTKMTGKTNEKGLKERDMRTETMETDLEAKVMRVAWQICFFNGLLLGSLGCSLSTLRRRLRGSSRRILSGSGRLSLRLRGRLGLGIALGRRISRDRLPGVRRQPSLKVLHLLRKRLALLLLLDQLDLFQGLDPDGFPVYAALGVVVEDMGDGRGAAADNLLEERVVDEVRRGLEPVDGASEDFVAGQAEFGDGGRQGLDACRRGRQDGAFLGEDVG